MIGRIVDAHHRPVDFANVALLNVRDSLRSQKGDSKSKLRGLYYDKQYI